jgi:hypothetical protein
VEDYDRTAITVPKEGTNVKAMETEFLRTMTDPKTYRALEVRKDNPKR